VRDIEQHPLSRPENRQSGDSALANDKLCKLQFGRKAFLTISKLLNDPVGTEMMLNLESKIRPIDAFESILTDPSIDVTAGCHNPPNTRINFGVFKTSYGLLC
jgi:hypothetical protein